VHWTRGPDAVPVLPQWAGPDPRDDHVWAPTAVRTGARFLLYITVPDRSSGAQCIAVLQSASPVGPFVDARGSPLVCQSSLGGSIDPSVFTSGGLHLVWKSGSACCGPVSTVWQQRLTPDGLSVTGQAHEILHADRPWQGGIIENPAILKARHGGWWLFYSGNQFDRSAYATGVAHCATLDGPCRETSDRPLLSGSDTLFSPGGLDVFRSSDGRVWAAYAVWNRPSRFGRFFCCRSVLIAPFRST